MKPTVYIETTIVSYLMARPSSDPVLAGQMAATREWWTLHRPRFELFTSGLTVAEASAGDPEAAEERLKVLATLPRVPVPEEAVRLADDLIAEAAMPPKARVDALHVAACAVNGIAYLLTWNCKHLANAELRRRIEEVCRQHGFDPPVICTPTDLREEVP